MKDFALAARRPTLLLVLLLASALGRPAAFASSITTLYSFTGGNDGTSPFAGLALGADGSFYGTAYAGGANFDGTVFQVTTNGVLTPLYAFTDNPGGSLPQSNLIPVGDGSFYGTSYEGGASSYGTVFQVTTNGLVTILHSFTGGNDGGFLLAAPVVGNDGNLYGVTAHGGPYTMANPSRQGYGTVFQLTTKGVLTTLYSFVGSTDDGGYPLGGLAIGPDGALYGTTYAFGANGYGTVFRVTTGGKLTTLHQFQGTNDGRGPAAALTPTGGGGFYGTTTVGGAYAASDTNNFETGFGTVFQISTNGSFSAIYSFRGGNDGSVPNGVVLGGDGTLYGTTQGGGSSGLGVVFNLTQAGAFTNLATFEGTNGATPEGLLTLGPDGNWYGTTSVGGANGDGTIFVLGPGVVVTPPALEFLSASAAANVFSFSWSSVAGRMYQVEYKSNLTQTNWTNLTQVTAAGPTASATDSIANGARFYRVALIQ